MFENQFNQSDSQGWEVRFILFNVMAVQVVTIGGKVLNILSITLLETGAQPIQVLPMPRVYKYITKVKNVTGHRLSKQAWK